MYQQPIAGLTLLALCCATGAAHRVNVDLPLSTWCCVPFCPAPCPKTSRPPRARSCARVWSSTWPRLWVCFFLGLDEHTADDEQARPLRCTSKSTSTQQSGKREQIVPKTVDAMTSIFFFLDKVSNHENIFEFQKCQLPTQKM